MGNRMRPSGLLLLVMAGYALLFGLFFSSGLGHGDDSAADLDLLQETVARFALTDLALSTEARYTRHPAVSDPLVVSMDHPGALDHFPSSLFWVPVRYRP